MSRKLHVRTLTAALALFGAGSIASAAAPDPAVETAYAAAVKEVPGLKKELVAGAKAEGKLVVYHLAIPFPQVLTEFRKRFPFVTIETFQGSGPPVYQKFTTEQRAGRYNADIWQHTDPAQTNGVVREGLLAQYKPLTAEKYAASIKNEGYWYPLALARIGIAYNPTVLNKDEIAAITNGGWDVAADPRWKGKAALMQLVGGAGTLPNYYWYKAKGMDFMKRVFANEPLLFNANNTALERLAAGEYGVIFNALEGTAYTQYKNGAPVRYVIPEPVLVVPFSQAIPKSAPHPNAARLFQEWFFSDAGQKIWQGISGYVTGNKDVPDARDVTREAWYRSGKAFWAWDYDAMDKAVPDLRAAYKTLTAPLAK